MISPLLASESWAASVDLARGVAEVVEQVASMLPADEARAHRASAAVMLLSVEHEAEAWSAQVDRWSAGADRIRAEANDATRAIMESEGVDRYEAMKLKHERGG